MLSESPSRQVKSVRTAFELVQVLQALGGASLTELADHLEMAKSTVHNYLATLENMGYVVNENGRYRLGLRFLTHGVAAKRTLGAQDLVRDTLPSVAEDISYPTWWIGEEFGRGIFLEKAIPDTREQIYGRIGKRSYLHTHALGKAILTELPRKYVERVVDHHGLPEQTQRTITDEEELFDQLRTVRDQGFAVSDGEAVLGVESIGVGFRGPNQRVNAIGVFGYSRDLAGNHSEDDISVRLMRAATTLEDALRTERN